jgi:lipopolysaccharide/colanic/teichoic acid biosynthesis glycosyltransferase
MKIIFDKIVSFFLLVILFPFFCVLGMLIFLSDREFPFYVAPRVGKDGFLFNMIKFRSMRRIKSLDNIVSTSENDPRITKIGRFIRKYKFDELSQFINVFLGNMSIVGPRPNVKVEVDLYTHLEMRILSIKPGITDFSSIVFSDLNKILGKSEDPNTDYNQLVRPWKSKLALFYIDNRSFWLDIIIILLTIVGILSRKSSLWCVRLILKKYGAPDDLLKICFVNRNLKPSPPPGSKIIVSSKIRKLQNSI